MSVLMKNEQMIAGLVSDESYSTEEKATGEQWIDGSTIYEKTVSCGALPNATDKTVSHGITNIGKVIDLSGYATNGALYLPLPFAGVSTSASVSVYVGASNITFEVGMNRSNFTESYVTLRYTKA